MGRFIDYLKAHGRMEDLAFVSYEHYPFDPCQVNWSDLFREPQLVEQNINDWREDGVPKDVPLMITESNVSWSLTDPMQDVFSALWLGDSVGDFLTHAGPNAVYYHSPVQPEPLRPGCQAWSTYGNFVATKELEIKQHTAQYFASLLLNLDWVEHGGGTHLAYRATADLQDDAKHDLITAYAVKRPDGQWSMLLINKDPSNAHEVKISFEDSGKPTAAHFMGPVKLVTFGAAEYVWHSSSVTSHADPDGPPASSVLEWKEGQEVLLPKASMTVLTGKVGGV